MPSSRRPSSPGSGTMRGSPRTRSSGRS
jgi:hypothetical protein